MPLTDTIDLLELIWTLITVAGVIQTALNIDDSLIDLRWVRDHYSRQALETRVAWDNLRTETFRCVIKISLLSVGVVSMLLPPRVEDLDAWQTQVAQVSRWLSPGALMLTVSLLLIDSIITRRVNRRMVLAVHRRHEAGDPVSEAERE